MLRFFASTLRPAFRNPEKIKGKKRRINEQSYTNEADYKRGLTKLFTKNIRKKKQKEQEE